MCRYHLNLKEKCLIDGKTGEILRPACFDDLAALYSYYLGTRQKEAAEEMIKDVFKGHKPITKMIERYQLKTGNTGKFPAIDPRSGKKNGSKGK